MSFEGGGGPFRAFDYFANGRPSRRQTSKRPLAIEERAPTTSTRPRFKERISLSGRDIAVHRRPAVGPGEHGGHGPPTRRWRAVHPRALPGTPPGRTALEWPYFSIKHGSIPRPRCGEHAAGGRPIPTLQPLCRFIPRAVAGTNTFLRITTNTDYITT